MAADGNPDRERRGRDSEHAKAEKRENRPADREAASLPGRARLSKRRKSDKAADESVKRARQPVEQFALDMADQSRIRAILLVRRHQFARSSARAAS